jgi:hypothetical protein
MLTALLNNANRLVSRVTTCYTWSPQFMLGLGKLVEKDRLREIVVSQRTD